MGRKLTALGADIFAGLFTQGVTEAGFAVRGHLEHGPYGVATAKLNFPGLDVRIGPHAWRPHEFKGRVDFMYANPPCAVWSNMRTGARLTWQKDERLQHVRDVSAAAAVIQPKAWCFESVVNAWRHGREFILDLAREWNHRGYHVTLLLQDNQYLGVPQARQRFFFIAHRHDLVLPPLVPPTTVAHTLNSVPKRLPAPPIIMKPLSPTYAELWARSAGTKGLLKTAWNGFTKAELKRWPLRPLNVVKRLQPNEPAPVMLASFTRLHPTEPRELTWYEWLALCGVPFSWNTAARGSDAATRELARAVMPPVGRWLATAVRDGIRLTPAASARTAVRTRVVDLRRRGAAVEELLWATRERDRSPAHWAPASKPVTPRHAASIVAQVDRVPRRGAGIGRRIRALLETGAPTTEILTTIHAEFPASKATAADVSWNRRKLRQLKETTP